MSAHITTNISYSLHFLVIAMPCISLGKGVVSGSSPDEGIPRNLSTTIKTDITAVMGVTFAVK